MKQKHAVIIGGGLGGLAIALRLAARNWAVTVCEQGPSFGGKMNRWIDQGYRFDTGPSLITMPWVFADLFRDSGTNIEEHLKIVPINPLAEYVYADGVRFTYSTSMPDWFQTIRQFEKDDVAGFIRFMRLGARLYEVSKETFLLQSPWELPHFKDVKVLKHLPLRFGWGNYHRTIAAHFKSPYLQQLYDRYPTYVGSSPYESPATLAVIPYLEYAFGGWYIEGGLYRLIESIIELAKRFGIELLLNSRVIYFLQSNKRVTGVQLADNSTIKADVIVMNGDASAIPGMLQKESITKSPLPLKKRSMSGLVFLVGTSRTLSHFKQHTIFFSGDYRQEFFELFNERKFPEDPTVYLNIPSRMDRSVVPGQGETLFIMANAPANDDDQWNENQVNNAWQRCFARLSANGFPDIEDDIVVRDVWTPNKIGARYLMPGGAIYGTNSHGWKNTFLRPPNKDRHLDSLYYVGGSSHPGGGTPTVLLSAQITSELIARYEAA